MGLQGLVVLALALLSVVAAGSVLGAVATGPRSMLVAQVVRGIGCWFAAARPFRLYDRDAARASRVFRGSDHAAAVEALRQDHAELAYLGPASYGLARRLRGGRVAPIFRYRHNAGHEGCHSAMSVKADSPVQRLEEMRGRTMAFSDANSTSGFQVPGWFLRRQGLDPATFFARTGFSASHEQSVIAVIT